MDTEKIKKGIDKIIEVLKNAQEKEIKKGIQSFLNLPLAPREREWDGAAAEKRVREWATENGNIDFNKYKRAFLYRNEEDPELLGSYKLGYADIIDGELKAIPRGIFAIAGVLQGARGGVDIPQAEQEEAKAIISRYYQKMKQDFKDDSIIPPWEVGKEDTKLEDKQEIKKEYEIPILKLDEEKKIVIGVVLEPDTEDSQGDIMTEEEIEKTAHFFLTKSRTIGERHRKKAQAEVVESYIAPSPMILNNQAIKKGSWIIAVKILDDSVWEKVKNGFYNSFSVGGFGVREPLKAVI